jgi:hypothetical protein
MAQVWHDLLFAHWPVPVDRLRALVPRALELDLHEGQAWIGVVPFRMSGVRPRGLPSVPYLSAFPELNVRTSVRGPRGDSSRPGVYFFSLDAGQALAVAFARTFFHLPYFRAAMRCEEKILPGPGSGETGIRFSSRRTHRGAPSAVFRAEYGPTGNPAPARPGTLEHFLAERYCLYAVQARKEGEGRVWRGEIHHAPWPIQPAFARIETNTMAHAAGLSLPPTEPLLHFARRLEVVVWPLRRLA